MRKICNACVGNFRYRIKSTLNKTKKQLQNILEISKKDDTSYIKTLEVILRYFVTLIQVWHHLNSKGLVGCIMNLRKLKTGAFKILYVRPIEIVISTTIRFLVRVVFACFKLAVR